MIEVQNITKTEMALIRILLSIWELPTKHPQAMNFIGKLNSMTVFKTMRFCLSFLHLQNMKLKIFAVYLVGN